jgi:hypothetical protein
MKKLPAGQAGNTGKRALPLGRYLKYAIGEIILVVIGILIALQLNIQKEEANEKKVIRELLSGIQADLKLEAERIDYLKNYYSVITDGIQRLILQKQGKEKYTNNELGKYFLHAFEFRKFSKINTNYQTLYNSGLLQKIENKELPIEIITYYSRLPLEWSLEIYQLKAGDFDFNNSDEFDPLDKIHTYIDYNSIPDFRLDIRTNFQTDFATFIEQPETLHFLLDLLNQSTLLFTNLQTYKESNLALSKQIDNYLNQ